MDMRPFVHTTNANLVVSQRTPPTPAGLDQRHSRPRGSRLRVDWVNLRPLSRVIVAQQFTYAQYGPLTGATTSLGHGSRR
jgi:hypothetical protein